MPRRRTGTLVRPGADGLWRARITADKPLANGKREKQRPLYSLGTTDKQCARRNLAKLVASIETGSAVLDAASSPMAPALVGDFAEAWPQKREAQGVVMAPKERGNLERHVLPEIGRLPLCDVRPSHVRAILDALSAKTYVKGTGRPDGSRYRRETLAKVRGVMHRLFRSAQDART